MYSTVHTLLFVARLDSVMLTTVTPSLDVRPYLSRNTGSIQISLSNRINGKPLRCIERAGEPGKIRRMETDRWCGVRLRASLSPSTSLPRTGKNRLHHHSCTSFFRVLIHDEYRNITKGHVWDFCLCNDGVCRAELIPLL
jgi:hypothetical protein